MKRLSLVVLLVLEVPAVAYVSVIAWLTSVWFLDDQAASQMNAADWWLVASKRLGICVIGAACFAAVVYLGTRLAVGRAGTKRNRAPVVNAAVVFVVVVVASLAGALQFAITKPYM
jgi:hypothetical protein